MAEISVNFMCFCSASLELSIDDFCTFEIIEVVIRSMNFVD